MIIGGGVGGVICLKYARDAGLKVLLLERGTRVGGLWRDLPHWQDIQFRKQDWTLGDLPLADETQPSILRNIEAWVERFNLAPHITLNSAVTNAQFRDGMWLVKTEATEYQSRWLIAATGGHNKSIVPQVDRQDSSIVEYHSSELRDPEELRGKRVAVVGGGASAYDLLDLSFTHEASKVAWIYRSTKWMRPTRKAKYFGINVRHLMKSQMLGASMSALNRRINKDFRARYAKAGITEIMPEHEFDILRDQIIPGRPRMIQNFGRIERHRGEVQSIRGNTIRLSNGNEIEADLLLWGTGYAVDLDYLGPSTLTQAGGLNAISGRCKSGFLSNVAPNLFLMAPGVLETNTSTPWAYAHAAKSIMSHITGAHVFVEPPSGTLINHCDIVKMLARHDRRNYPFGLWYLKYLWLALFHPKGKPMPIP